MSIGANNTSTNLRKGAINYKNNLINGAGYNNYGYNPEQKLLTVLFLFLPVPCTGPCGWQADIIMQTKRIWKN